MGQGLQTDAMTHGAADAQQWKNVNSSCSLAAGAVYRRGATRARTASSGNAAKHVGGFIG